MSSHLHAGPPAPLPLPRPSGATAAAVHGGPTARAASAGDGSPARGIPRAAAAPGGNARDPASPKGKRCRKKRVLVPAGWRLCREAGAPVASLPLFSLKVPLDGAPAGKGGGDPWTPATFLRFAAARGTPVGLVIDLTYTTRYYSPAALAAAGVQHLRIPERGHSAVPARANVARFCAAVEDLWRRRPGAHVAVHCTHGLNRSGYMIVSLLLARGLPLPAALDAFARASPPGIWDAEYIRHLYRTAGLAPPPDRLLPAPPPWRRAKRDPPPPAAEAARGAREAAGGGAAGARASGDAVRWLAARARARPTVVVMRGLAGSGKSSFLARLRAALPALAVCSADALFEARSGDAAEAAEARSGRGYAFDARRLPAAHDACLRTFVLALTQGAQAVAVDNTNSRGAEFAPYLALARAFGYAASVVELHCAADGVARRFCARSVHRPPWDVVRRMRARWEPHPDALLVAPDFARARGATRGERRGGAAAAGAGGLGTVHDEAE